MIRVTPATTDIIWQIGTEHPANINLELLIPSVWEQIPGYTPRFEYTINGQFGILQIIEGPQYGADATQLNEIENVVIGFSNMETLSEGGHTFTITFRIHQPSPHGGLTIDSGTATIKLMVEAGLVISASVSEITHTHIIGSPITQSFDIDVYCDVLWSAQINGFGFQFADGSMEYVGYGNQTISLYLNDAVSDLEEEGLHNGTLTLIRENNTAIVEIPLLLNVREADDVSITPETITLEIDFLADAHTNEMIVASHPGLTVDSIVVPEFASVNLVGQDNDQLTRYLVQPNEEFLFMPGSQHSGIIEFVINGLSYFVNLVIDVSAAFDNSYIKDVHFTLDNELLRFRSSVSEESYLEINAEIVIFDLQGNRIELERVWELPFYKNKAELNLGLEIDNYLNLINIPNQSYNFGIRTELQPQYDPLLVSLSCKEISYSHRVVLNEYEVPMQRFLRGRSVSLNLSCILTHDSNEVRKVEKSGKIMFNIFKPRLGKGAPLKIYRNNDVLKTIYVGRNNMIGNNISVNQNFQTTIKKHTYLYSMLFNLANEDIGVGDEIIIEYGINKLKYIVYPDSVEKESIIYINEWETFDLIEVYGRKQTKAQLQHVISNASGGLINETRKHASTDEQTLNKSTGWIFKKNIKTIMQLLKSRKAFLLDKDAFSHGGSETINRYVRFTELIPTAEKVEIFDSKRQLYSYDLEFKINKKNDNEVYTF